MRQCPVHGTHSPAAVHPALVIDKGGAGQPGPVSHEPETGGGYVNRYTQVSRLAINRSAALFQRRDDLTGRRHTRRTMLADLGAERHS